MSSSINPCDEDKVQKELGLFLNLSTQYSITLSKLFVLSILKPSLDSF